MRHAEILKAVYDPANRADPYPLFAELRRVPVSWQEDGPTAEGTYAVSTYREIVALLRDPRLTSDFRRTEATARFVRREPLPFIARDEPEHDRLRSLAMRHFGPPERPRYVDELVPEIERVARELVDDLRGEGSFDLVARVAYALPVAIICAILGVPREDRSKFRVWAERIVANASLLTPEATRAIDEASTAIRGYLGELVARRRVEPTGDLLSRMANDEPPRRMGEPDLLATMALLLVAGHETTTNLIGNGVIAFLRNPEALARLRGEPERMPSAVEEILRYDPPVQFLTNRASLDAIPVGGATIPKGSLVTLVLAAGNRDPARFREPDRFVLDRDDNAHLGFGSGIHYCFGAPLARVEGRIALTELVRRLERPRLVVDPPPYRDGVSLRGPRELRIEVDAVRDADDARRS